MSSLTEIHYRAAVDTLTKAADALRDYSRLPSATNGGDMIATLVAVAQTHALLALVVAHDPWLDRAGVEVESDACA